MGNKKISFNLQTLQRNNMILEIKSSHYMKFTLGTNFADEFSRSIFDDYCCAVIFCQT